MKKLTAFLFCIVMVFSSFAFSASAEENLYERFIEVERFHSSFQYYVHVAIDGNDQTEEYIVKNGEEYRPGVIIGRASYMAFEYEGKYPINSESRIDNKYFPAYMNVPEKDFIEYSKKHFNLSDKTLEKIRNLKYKSVGHFGNEGTALYDKVTGNYKVFIENKEDMDALNAIRKNIIRIFVGYTKNGNNYDIYLNKYAREHWETVPAGKIKNVDYVETYDDVYNEQEYWVLSNDWMKYTVSYDGKDIKYISNVKVNGVPKTLITADGEVEYPERMQYKPEPEKTSKPSSAVNSTTSKEQSKVSSTSSVTSTSSVSSVSSATSSQATVSTETSSKETTVSIETVTEPEESSSQEQVTTIGATEDTESEEKTKDSKNGYAIFIIIGAVAVVALAAAAVWFFIKKK